MIHKIRRAFLCCLLFIIQFSLFNYSSLAQDYTLSSKDTTEVRFLNQRKFFIYKVDKGETVYSISKKFKIPQQEINEFNTELKDGLKPKMKLWIPAYSHLKKEEPKPEVKENESLAANETYRVALLLSLHVAENFTKDSSLLDSSYVNESLQVSTVANLEFYEGILKAIDSLESLKLRVNLTLYDTEDDSSKTVELLRKAELQNTGLIISNGNAVVTKLINAFSIKNKIRFASCTLNSGDLISDNGSAISVIPSSLVQCREAGKIAAEKFRDYNCIVLKTAPGKENERSAAFKLGWLKESNAKAKEINFVKTIKDSMSVFVKTVKDSMSSKLNNLIFVPSSNEDFVSSLIASLKDYSEEYRITMIGLPTWQYFETIDPLLFELFDAHIFTASFINYNAPDAVRFRKYFFKTYNTEPAENAFLGFDLMMMMGTEFPGHGKKIEDDIAGQSLKGLYTNYRFERTESSFIENSFISMCKYRNYELKRINE